MENITLDSEAQDSKATTAAVGKHKDSDAVEFVKRLKTVDQELETLKEDRSELIKEFKEKLDMKTFRLAMQSCKIQKKVENKDTFDSFCELIEENNAV
jgi:hypothetical protein